MVLRIQHLSLQCPQLAIEVRSFCQPRQYNLKWAGLSCVVLGHLPAPQCGALLARHDGDSISLNFQQKKLMPAQVANLPHPCSALFRRQGVTVLSAIYYITHAAANRSNNVANERWILPKWPKCYVVDRTTALEDCNLSGISESEKILT